MTPIGIVGYILLTITAVALLPGIVQDIRYHITGEPGAKQFYNDMLEERNKRILALEFSLQNSAKALRLEEKENRRKAKEIKRLEAEIALLKLMEDFPNDQRAKEKLP